jgi:hypothetical protein
MGVLTDKLLIYDCKSRRGERRVRAVATHWSIWNIGQSGDFTPPDWSMSIPLVKLHHIDQFHENQRMVSSIGSSDHFSDNLLGVLPTYGNAYIHLRRFLKC